MIVLDTSAALEALVASSPDPELLARLGQAGSVQVPHLVDAEALSALRGLVRGGRLEEPRAWDAWRDFDDLRLLRYPMRGLAGRVWALRHEMTAYDATFVALAQALGCPLVTCDRRLARAAHAGVAVEVFAAS